MTAPRKPGRGDRRAAFAAARYADAADDPEAFVAAAWSHWRAARKRAAARDPDAAAAEALRLGRVIQQSATNLGRVR